MPLKRSISYTRDQVAAIADCQNEMHGLSTKIALAAGLRAHELLTLRLARERPADGQPSAKEKFSVREGVLYTVIGKFGFTQRGGNWLCRHVLLPSSLAAELETLRLAEPKDLVDRGTRYSMLYAIGGGQRWSNSFSQASNAALGRSNGANGLRQVYVTPMLKSAWGSCSGVVLLSPMHLSLSLKKWAVLHLGLSSVNWFK